MLVNVVSWFDVLDFVIDGSSKLLVIFVSLGLDLMMVGSRPLLEKCWSLLVDLD
jgi:hypothetical protein